MNRYPATGDIITVPSKRGDMLVVSHRKYVADEEVLTFGYEFRVVPAAKADKLTGVIDDKHGINYHILPSDVIPSQKINRVEMNELRLIGQAKFSTQVTKTYTVTRRKDVV